MLQIYISHAMADRPYLDKLLRWLKPLQEQYFLRIFHNTPSYSAQLPFHWDDMLDHLGESHIYLFLSSYHSLSSSYIEQEEIPRAVERYTEFGPNFVRIYPILVSPSHWKKNSRLAGFKPLGGSKTLAEIKPEEEAYLKIVEELRTIIEELRRNWIEEHHRVGLPTEDFFRLALPPPKTSEFQALPGWVGILLILVLLYLVTSWYFSGCAPRMYYQYAPKEMPYQPPPDRYLRNNPVLPPEDVPLRPNEDTAGLRQRLPADF